MKVDPLQEAVSNQIRSLRKARGWSLSDVESLTQGNITAVALGSYERGDRTVSLRRLSEIANFYEVPLPYLLGAGKCKGSSTRMTPLAIDLRKLKTLSENSSNRSDPTLIALTTLVTSIAHRRGDWNAEVMSLRQSDLLTLSLMTMMSEEDQMQALIKCELLLTAPNRP